MPKYRKKPVEIEARPWDGTALGATPIINWVEECGGWANYRCTTDQCSGDETDHVIRIRTLEGDMQAQPGDFIIKGVQGEFYPCKPGIFAETHEEVVDND